MTAKTKTPTITERAKTLSEKTEDAYSFGDYNSWSAVCAMLLRRGFTEREAEAILRSKWMRWAGDAESRNEGCTTKTLEKFLDSKGQNLLREVEQLTAETFAD